MIKRIFNAGILLSLITMFVSCGEDVGSKFEMTIPMIEEGVKISPENINIYLDCSGSMKGYVEFLNYPEAKGTIKEILPNFITLSKSKYSGLKINCSGISDNTFTNYSSNDFPDQLIDGTIFRGQTTELNKIVELVVGQISNDNSNDIYIIVSDLVMSFGDAEVINNPYKNITNIAILGNSLSSSILKLKPYNMSVALFQYYSDFNGRYYCNCKENYNDNKQKVNSFASELLKDRPFYFLVFGKQDVIETMIEDKCFQSYIEMYSSFNFKTKEIEASSVIYRGKGNLTANWRIGENKNKGGKIYQIAKHQNDDFQPVFYVDFSMLQLPVFLKRNEDYITSHPIIDGRVITSCEKCDYINEKEDIIGLKHPPSLLYRITLNNQKELPIGSTEGFFKLIYSNPLTGSSIMRDDTLSSSKELERKTFALDEVIKAISMSFEQNEEVAKIIIPVEKKK